MDNLGDVFIRWLPPFLWAIVIFTFSSIPSLRASQIDWKDFVIRKSAHIGEYTFFAFLIYRANLSGGMNRADSMFYALLMTILYAFTDEYHQSLVPGRGPHLSDVAIDSTGALVGMIFIKKLTSINSLNNLSRKIGI